LQKQGKIRIRANTIHTMQGQEAKVVIFILGGASAGARAWASAKPNLLNVALTRAKEYIYIVGDKDAWGGLNYFSVAAREI
jgi:DNA helicase related protein